MTHCNAHHFIEYFFRSFSNSHFVCARTKLLPSGTLFCFMIYFGTNFVDYNLQMGCIFIHHRWDNVWEGQTKWRQSKDENYLLYTLPGSRNAKSPTVMVCYIFRLVKTAEELRRQSSPDRAFQNSYFWLWFFLLGFWWLVGVINIIYSYCFITHTHTWLVIFSFDIFHLVFRFLRTQIYVS